MRRRVFAGLTLLMILLLATPSSFGWGENGERMIVDKAVDTLPDEMRPFFQANRQFLVQHVTDPVESEARNPAEQRNSFIQLDRYGQFPFAALPRSYTAAVTKFGKRTLESHGLLPWQVGLYSQKLTDALRAHNWDDAKLSAAILAHYVAAAHDPFKSTMNSDGALSNQPGVDERFGSGLVDHYQRFFFLKPNEAAFIRDPTDHAFDMSLSAHSWLENILLADRRAHEGLSGYKDDYYDRFYAQAGAVLIRQLSDASTDVGSYWMTAWINAGRPQLPAY
ncbi:MAG TPA: hypothetical protein VN822_08115 [Candidatus Acidoferrales bacterium]|nr:hypothetical protein [Candidatus Acidoferrales bacterium]